MPYSIASWPGNGDVVNGEPDQLAPYVDHNSNGIHGPTTGEYPLIRGDQAVNSVQHPIADLDGLHPALPMDIHVLHYVYSSADEDLWNTVFTNHRFINRSGSSFTNVRIRTFNDFDIGCSSDDFAGCDHCWICSSCTTGMIMTGLVPMPLDTGNNHPHKGVCPSMQR